MRTRISQRLVPAALAMGLAVLTGCGDDTGTKTVTAADYSFKNLPSSVDAGTTLTLKNSSTKELHELVVVRIPDSEKRSVADLIKLPEAESDAIFSAGPPAMVLLAPPGGGEVIKAVGDGKLTQKGRYAVICAIPTGADPAAYLAAAEAAGDGPPQVAGGPPHLANGMFGQITVK